MATHKHLSDDSNPMKGSMKDIHDNKEHAGNNAERLTHEDIEKELVEIFHRINERFPSGRLSAYLEYNFVSGKQPDAGQVMRDLKFIYDGKQPKYTDDDSKSEAAFFIRRLRTMTSVKK